MSGKGDADQFLFLILSESGYYSSAEQAKFRQEAAALKKLPPPEYARQKGDYMFERKQYGKAARHLWKRLPGCLRAEQ